MSNFGFKNILGIIAGFICIATSLVTFIHKENLINTGLETTAIVTDVTRLRRSTAVYVQYIIDGEEYNHRLNIQSHNRYRGEEVVILYNPNNPDIITPKNRDIATDNIGYMVIYFAIGVLSILISVSSGQRDAQKAKYKMFS